MERTTVDALRGEPLVTMTASFDVEERRARANENLYFWRLFISFIQRERTNLPWQSRTPTWSDAWPRSWWITFLVSPRSSLLTGWLLAWSFGLTSHPDPTYIYKLTSTNEFLVPGSLLVTRTALAQLRNFFFLLIIIDMALRPEKMGYLLFPDGIKLSGH